MAASLSDKALAVFAFAAYHELGTGQRVASVVRRDGAGHEADPEAVAELTGHGLASVEGDRIVFTPEGEAKLRAAIAGLRNGLGGSNG